MQYYYSIRRDLLFIYATTEGNLKIITRVKEVRPKKKKKKHTMNDSIYTELCCCCITLVVSDSV